MQPGLTGAEQTAIDDAGRLATFIENEIISDGATRADDIRELEFYVHGIQHMIMAQAAARAYPGTYRKLGEAL